MCKKLLSIIILVCLTFNLFGQFTSGKCYAQSFIPNIFEHKEEKYPIYQGIYHDTIDYIEKIELVISPTITEWGKRKTECLTPDSTICFAWCLIEKPKEILELIIVNDTSKTNNYTWKEFEVRLLIEEGGKVDEIRREVICNYNLTSDFYRKVLKALSIQGYYSGSIEDFSPSEVKEIFHQYQKDNGLSFGQWTLETLDVLGVKY